MMFFSLPVFLLMLGAAILGFLIAWIWIRSKIDQMESNKLKQQEQFLQLQRNYQDLLVHSNTQQGEKEKLIKKNDDQHFQLAQLKISNQQLADDNELLIKEIQQFRKNNSKNLPLPRQIAGELASMKSRIDELNQEKENWREKYMIIRDANDEHLAKLSAMAKDTDDTEAEPKETQSVSGKIDWREEFQQMQLELNQKIKEYQDVNLQLRKEYQEMKDHYQAKLDLYYDNPEMINLPPKKRKSKKNNDPEDEGF